MSNWLYANVEPTSPWRGVQSLPRELSLRTTPDGIRLVQRPIRELAALRNEPPRTIHGATDLPGSADIELAVTQGDWREAGLRFSNDGGEEAIVGVSASPAEVFIDRRRSRATPFHAAYPGRHGGPVRWIDGRIALRVVFDRTTIEVFANDGELVISDRIFPTHPLDRIEPLNDGRGIDAAARLWEIVVSRQ
jgi:sucrose-6-phosphate hydrolase SacC (GH32 family)